MAVAILVLVRAVLHHVATAAIQVVPLHADVAHASLVRDAARRTAVLLHATPAVLLLVATAAAAAAGRQAALDVFAHAGHHAVVVAVREMLDATTLVLQAVPLHVIVNVIAEFVGPDVAVPATTAVPLLVAVPIAAQPLLVQSAPG
ncbi:MAG: hypothetical protein R3C01_05615 [Planctomycetaceae bacterium]